MDCMLYEAIKTFLCVFHFYHQLTMMKAHTVDTNFLDEQQ